MRQRDSRAQVLIFVILSLIAIGPAWADDDRDKGRPTNKGVDLRSHGRELADRVREKGLKVERAPERHESRGHESRERDKELEEEGLSVQINDPALDHIQTLAGTRPFEYSIQSETSIVAFGDDIVVGYNSSADTLVVQGPEGLAFDHKHASAFSVSHDGGRTWTSGFVPPVPGSVFTFGDPSLAVDRRGNFFYASLGTDANGINAIIVNKSTDRGRTFAPAVIAAVDDGADKPWLAVGRDPFDRRRDNLYIAWRSFQSNNTRSVLQFVRSTDGGQNWSPQTVFAPTDTGILSAFVQFSNPVVDASSGRLYIPFLHLSNIDADFIRVLVSDDGGQTFDFLRFNVAGAPDPFAFPNVTPGERTDCGAGRDGGVRLVIHQGANLGGGRAGFTRFRQATRLFTQPSAAAESGKIFIALNSSTSPTFDDPNANSEIRLLFSLNGGVSWQAVTVVPAIFDRHHVLPSIAANKGGERLHIAYYVQQADERVRVDLLRAKVEDGRVEVEHVRTLSSAAFDLTPSNNPVEFSPTDPVLTANYDRIFSACYDVGEYLSVFAKGSEVLAAWGENRNRWTSPAGSPAAGTHAQPDVFFQRLED